MNISKNNIDELLFEYFEGNLTNSEKGELMNFIHQNPEYNEDFSSWAQSYAHADKPIKDYGIAVKLVQPEPMKYSQKVILVSIALGLFLISAVYVFTREDSVVQKRSVVSGSSVSNQQEKDQVITAIPQKSNENYPSLYHDSKGFKKVEKESQKELSPGVTPYPDSLPIVHDQFKNGMDSILSNNDSSDPVVSTDSIPMKNFNVNREKTSKNKTKKRLNLRPSSNFLPVNKDL